MKAILKRWKFTNNSTIGTLTITGIDGNIFECYTLEDTVRGDGNAATVSSWKIAGKSAIPYGKYEVKVTWSNKFMEYRWEVTNVPGYKGIRIHSGNVPADTEGCLLLGTGIGTDYVNQSVIAMNNFNDFCKKNNPANEAWTIEITK